MIEQAGSCDKEGLGVFAKIAWSTGIIDVLPSSYAKWKRQGILMLFLDMDEPLVDFVGGAAKLWGTNRQVVLSHWQPGEYDMLPALQRALGLPKRMTLQEFWEPMLNEDFWLGLEEQPWFSRVIQAAEQCAGRDWYVLTDAGPCHTGHSGKLRWLRKRLGGSFDRMIATRDKWLLAAPGRLLLDDNETHCTAFNLSKGQSLTFPAIWNKYGATAETIRDKYLDHLGYVIQEALRS